MAYKCSFLDNQVYTAQDVSDIFARISHGGVVFTDTGYTLGDLNAAQNSAVTEGVVRDENSCKVIKENDVYKISKGACFMNDGTAIIFDDEGVEIEIVPETKNYVYLYRNTPKNSIDIVVSSNPGGENCVPLAEVDILGCIHDRRAYAKAKVDTLACGAIRNFTVYFSDTVPSESETVTVDMENSNFSYIVIWGGRMEHLDSYEYRISTEENLVELIDGEDVAIHLGEYRGMVDEIMHCTKDGQYLHIYLSSPHPGGGYTLNLGVI